jgi:hypothetical protein
MNIEKIYIITKTTTDDYGCTDRVDVIAAYKDYKSAAQKLKKIASDNNIKHSVISDEYKDLIHSYVWKTIDENHSVMWAISEIPIDDEIKIGLPTIVPAPDSIKRAMGMDVPYKRIV